MQNDYIKVSRKACVEMSNSSAYYTDLLYRDPQLSAVLNVAYECNDGIVLTRVFEYKGGTI